MPKVFEQFTEIVAAGSDKADGNLSFKFSGKNVVGNREVFLNKYGLALDDLVTAQQPHGNLVAVVGEDERGKGSREKDWLDGIEGLVTDVPGIVLGVESADCLPVYFYDPVNKVVGLAHAGWRSVVKGVVTKMVKKMIDVYDCQSGNIKVTVGPHIKSCCFEIKDDVLPKFMRQTDRITGENGKLLVNLSGIVTDQLLSEGLSSSNIEITDTCTKDSLDFYSYRREHKGLSGAQLSIISLL